MTQEDVLTKRARLETSIKRNPHPDFKGVETSRPAWQSERSGWTYTKIVNPDWKFGDGGNDGGASLEKEHIEINPYAEGRPATFNYKLLISAIVPRPVGFLSTVGQDGIVLSVGSSSLFAPLTETGTSNLAPFSFMNMINYDPPLFTVGFTGCGIDNAKDTLKNLIDTGECTDTTCHSATWDGDRLLTEQASSMSSRNTSLKRPTQRPSTPPTASVSGK